MIRTGLCLAAILAVGCGSSYPAPSDRIGLSEAATYDARQSGAEEQPQAALHLRYADENLARAKALLRDGENRRADYVLMRAEAEAQLALALAKAEDARIEARGVLERIDQLRELAAPPK